MNSNEETIKKQSEEFARSHKKEIARKITDTSVHTPVDNPISIFMAGSPGAGKTEFSKNLIEILEKGSKRKIIRIDGDELRTYLPGYTGANSYLFQNAISILVDKIHDEALSNRQNFILDGTFSNYNKASENVRRSLHKKRRVFIFYVYQRPEVAWKFTASREIEKGRNIPKEAFIKHFLNSQETIHSIHKEFKNNVTIRAIYEEFKNYVTIFIVKKNFETHQVEKVIELETDKDNIEDYIKIRYTEDELHKILC